MARRSNSPSVALDAGGDQEQPIVASVIPPSWPAPAGGNGPSTPREVNQHPLAPTARPAAAPKAPPPPAAAPPIAGIGGPPSFSAYVSQVDMGDVELDDRYEVLPDDLYVEGEIKSCDYRQNEGNAACALHVRLELTYPLEYKGVTIRDKVTLPDEMVHISDQQINAIKKRFKMFCDAAEKLSADGKFCTAKSSHEFVGEIVAFRTKNNTSVYTDKSGETRERTFTNVGFGYYRAEKTEGLRSSGETVQTPSASWRPQG